MPSPLGPHKESVASLDQRMIPLVCGEAELWLMLPLAELHQRLKVVNSGMDSIHLQRQLDSFIQVSVGISWDARILRYVLLQPQ